MSKIFESYLDNAYLAFKDGISIVLVNESVSILSGNIFAIDGIEDFVEAMMQADSAVTSDEVCEYIFANLQPAELYFHSVNFARAA